ncbi:hypothetical protein [Micromonospora radicis]|uniref:hypothetical protein n=1 Tax=Micromonospora radicis TaxID=1894971 RepID=UPI0011C4773B|nr:hypothetical protein [Micromonospora radicis]
MRHHPRRPRPASCWLAAFLLVGSTACTRTEDPAPPAVPPVFESVDPQAAESGPQPAGSATAAPPTDAALDPCLLVTRQEAEELARTPLNDARPARNSCTYTGPVSGPTAQVEVYVGDGARKQLDVQRALGHELTVLPGIGDESYLWAKGRMVFVSSAQRWVSVRLVRLDDPARNRGPLTDLAGTVAGRI